MQTAIVPVSAGVLSALGMLAAPRSRQLSRTATGPLQDLSAETIQTQLDGLAEQGRQDLLAEGVEPDAVRREDTLDLRYVGQSYTLQVPWTNPDQATQEFHALHRQRYGHAMDLPVELVTLRVALFGDLPKPDLAQIAARTTGQPEPEGVEDDWLSAPVYHRDRLMAGDCIQGEALIVETIATTYLAPGWSCRVDDFGNLILQSNPGNTAN